MRCFAGRKREGIKENKNESNVPIFGIYVAGGIAETLIIPMTKTKDKCDKNISTDCVL